ncbi:MAG TPA: hypothetical protein VKC34_04210 [Blastocatellia bacterium]|nr:hypothetical protein [Blastocatellia bacterium]
MTAEGAIASFLAQAGARPKAGDPVSAHVDMAASLGLLVAFLSGKKIRDLAEITPRVLRDFIARWYVEEATFPSQTRYQLHASSELSGPCSALLPEPLELMRVLDIFWDWIDRHDSTGTPGILREVVSELGSTMPRAVEIGRALSLHVIERGGAFAFPEFLSSFEEGGQSQYDIDTPGDVGALESYFRITRIEGERAEVEDVITEERIWPVLFPVEIARRLGPGFVINLELVRSLQLWHIVDCGFTYPPGTEF